MSLRRVLSTLSVVVIASAGVVIAAPKKTPAKKLPPAAAGSGSGTGSGSGSAMPAAAGSGSGSAAPVVPDEPPPKDIQGTDENPDAPKEVGDPDATPVPVVVKAAPTGYPIELALRPITLPENMPELAIGPHFAVDAPFGTPAGTHLEFIASDALRARYGITRQIQLGLTYEYGGVYKNQDGTFGFNTGRAVGLDLTVLLQNWIAVQVGVPVYLDPVAVALTIAVPLKFTFGDKFALGGLDDLLSIKLDRFAPTFYNQSTNETAVAASGLNGQQSSGDLRFSAYGIYQAQRNLAIIGRIGLDLQDLGNGVTTTNLRAAVQYSPVNAVDLGVGIGFDDLAHGGTFGPSFLVAVRI